MRLLRFLLSGLAVGLAMSALLALEYAGKNSFADSNLSELVLVPPPVLLVSPLLGMIIGAIAVRFQDSEQLATMVGFMIGSVLGFIAAVIIYGASPFPGHGFIFHAFNGILFGGAIGFVTPLVATRIRKSSDYIK